MVGRFGFIIFMLSNFIIINLDVVEVFIINDRFLYFRKFLGFRGYFLRIQEKDQINCLIYKINRRQYSRDGFEK